MFKNPLNIITIILSLFFIGGGVYYYLNRNNALTNINTNLNALSGDASNKTSIVSNATQLTNNFQYAIIFIWLLAGILLFCSGHGIWKEYRSI